MEEKTNIFLKMQNTACVSNSVAVVAAVNKDEALVGNLAKSPCLLKGDIPLIVERGHESAAKAYNAGLSRTNAEIIVFAHQDVYLPERWDLQLLAAVQYLELHDKNWAVLGVVGFDRNGAIVGRVWSSGLKREIEGTSCSSPVPVVSIDELLIVLNAKVGLKFDENLPGYHLYGTDIVQTAIERGLTAYVFEAPIIHNSTAVVWLDRSYGRAYRYMQRKWKAKLPIETTVVPITRYGWPLFRKRICAFKRNTLERRPIAIKYESPQVIAMRLGYEKKI
ncbi:MAG: glycosyltransferase [Planctomycetota bacterium]